MSERYTVELAKPLLLVSLTGDEAVVTMEMVTKGLLGRAPDPRYVSYCSRRGQVVARAENMVEDAARETHAELVAWSHLHQRKAGGGAKRREITAAYSG